MAPPKFSDFSKSVDDLLTNDFCFDRKLKLKTKAANSYELTPEFTLKSSGPVSAKLTGKFELTKGITVNKVGVSDDGRYFADIAYTNVLPNLSLSTVVEEGGKAPTLGEFSATYKHEVFVASAKLDAITGPTVKASLSAVVPKFEFCTLGAEVKYNTLFDSKAPKSSSSIGSGGKFGEIADWSFGLALTQKDLIFSALLTKKCSEASFTLAQVISPKAEIVGKFTHGLKSEIKTLTVGGSYIVDPVTKVQAKVDNNGVVSANIHQTLSDKVKLISSFQVDAKSLNAETHKFGLQLQLS